MEVSEEDLSILSLIPKDDDGKPKLLEGALNILKKHLEDTRKDSSNLEVHRIFTNDGVKKREKLEIIEGEINGDWVEMSFPGRPQGKSSAKSKHVENLVEQMAHTQISPTLAEKLTIFKEQSEILEDKFVLAYQMPVEMRETGIAIMKLLHKAEVLEKSKDHKKLNLMETVKNLSCKIYDLNEWAKQISTKEKYGYTDMKKFISTKFMYIHPITNEYKRLKDSTRATYVSVAQVIHKFEEEKFKHKGVSLLRHFPQGKQHLYDNAKIYLKLFYDENYHLIRELQCKIEQRRILEICRKRRNEDILLSNITIEKRKRK